MSEPTTADVLRRIRVVTHRGRAYLVLESADGIGGALMKVPSNMSSLAWEWDRKRDAALAKEAPNV